MPHTSPADDSDPRPTDPQFQFLMLRCARKAQDRTLESLAREWLAEVGIHVVFTDDLVGPSDDQEVSDAA